MNWDFVLTCFEPITQVTGGIGTYTRCLLEQLSPFAAQRNLNILFLTPYQPDPAWIAEAKATHIHVVLIGCTAKIGAADLEGVGDQHSGFSFNVAQHLEEINKSGDAIGLVEFSDFGRDGYYSIKKKRLGLLKCGQLAVRLHSPDLMLLPDNQLPLRCYDAETLYKLEQEIYCYKFCDLILFGGDNMLSRIEAETVKYGVSIRHKAQKIHHPFRQLPSQKNYYSRSAVEKGDLNSIYKIMSSKDYVKLVYSGRIERRKGIAEFLEAIIADQSLQRLISSANLKIVACGRDTNTGQDGSSLTTELKSLIAGSALADKIVFADYINQDDLYKVVLPNADGFVFPSLFENYPNAFIETLPFGRPTLVSSSGCMPEIGASFSFVEAYDPHASSAPIAITRFITSLLYKVKSENRASKQLSVDTATGRYLAYALRHNTEISKRYLGLIENCPNQITGNKKRPPIAFVISCQDDDEQLKYTIETVARCIQADDDVFIILSQSSHDSQFAELLGKDIKVEFILAKKESRLGEERNRAALATACEFIQFVTSGDRIAPEGFENSCRALNDNDDLDFVYGLRNPIPVQTLAYAPRDASPTALERNPMADSLLIRRNAFLDAGGFDRQLPLIYADWELVIKLTLLERGGEAIPCTTCYASKTFEEPSQLAPHQSTIWHMRVIQKAVENTHVGREDSGYSQIYVSRAAIFLHRLLFERGQQDAGGVSPKPATFDYMFPIATGRSINSEFSFRSAAKLHLLDKYRGHSLFTAVQQAIVATQNMSEPEKIEYVRTAVLFDANWYLIVNTDVRAAGLDPCEHYALYGINENRNPNAWLNAGEMRSVVEELAAENESDSPFIVFSLLME